MPRVYREILHLLEKTFLDSYTVKDIHIAVGPGGGTPFRATDAESTLRGQSLNEETFVRALDALLLQAKFRDSARRASADYRRRIVGGLFKDVLNTAWKRAL